MYTPVVVVFWTALLFVAYSYLFYPLLLTLCSRLFGKDVASDLGYLPSVGFLVPVYNEEEVIEKKIRNIFAVDYPPEKISIWIGSDQSSDRSVALARSFKDSRVHVWEAPRRGGKTEILNHLAPQIDADIIIFTDANTMHESTGIRRLVSVFADKTVGGAGGVILHATQGTQEFEEMAYRSFESYQKILESRLHSTISAFGGFYALRRGLFTPIPENAYSNDDVLIPMNIVRQGFRVVFVPQAVSYEDMTEDLAQEFKRRVRIGAGNVQAFTWLLDFLSPFKGWPCFCYVSHKVTRWFSPLFIVLGLVACAILSEAAHIPFYRVLFGAAVVAVAAAFSSQIVPLKPTRRLFYFLAMNAALCLGYFRFAKGIRSAAWDRTQRS